MANGFPIIYEMEFLTQLPKHKWMRRTEGTEIIVRWIIAADLEETECDCSPIASGRDNWPDRS
jgi:hypothetical protein